jgi:hypothetical protein
MDLKFLTLMLIKNFKCLLFFFFRGENTFWEDGISTTESPLVLTKNYLIFCIFVLNKYIIWTYSISRQKAI